MLGTGNLANNPELVKLRILDENLQPTLYETSIYPNYTLSICPYIHSSVWFSPPHQENFSL